MPASVRDSLMLLAQAALGEGRYQDAIDICLQLLSEDSNHFEPHLVAGVAAFRLGDNAFALQHLKAALDLQPQSADAIKWMAKLLHSTGDIAGAIHLGSRGIKLFPADTDLRAGLAQHLLDSGRINEAISHLQRALAEKPKSSSLHLLIAAALEAGGNDKAAFQAYQNAIRLNPNSAESHAKIGRLLLAHSEFEPAIAAFTNALKLEPNLAHARVWLAQALIAVDRESEATEHLQKAIELDPTSSESYAMLAYRQQTRGEFDQAQENFRKSIALQPSQAISFYGITQGARISPQDRDLLTQMVALAEAQTLRAHDQMILLFSIAKAHADLAEYELAMANYEEANRIAFNVSLGGKAFPQEQYAKVLDETIATYTPGFIKEQRQLGDLSNQPIFIVGMMRSGTTLVDQIISSHPQVASMGEREFWLQYPNVALGDKWARQIQSQYLQLQVSAANGVTRVTDKTPQNYQALGLIHTMFPNAPIVHVRRNPIDNCLSIYTNPYEKSPDFAHDKGSIVFAYRSYLRLMEHWRTVLPATQFIEIDYEEIVSDHEAVVRRIIQHCRLEWDNACLSHERNQNAVKTPSLWQVRQPIYGNSVGRWRHFEPWLGELGQV